ncbi:MAG: TolC family protein [Aquabacterium sp.]|jgi:NodT family efflux transporter outer membrane factor (OMF) lipoprotein|uniref:TolC family protein n=1 Tax=Aquabacterium sp. TaxID=1872578 RepID=UPI001B5799D4|nr:TolC family protein [Aquabacterium sp.]MBP7131645.1 TolC family protein [Aquabacterium sp.]MBP9063905.1 TolC family protein [Aquabacterium sp.]MDQ5927146.1 hypothetical protein [Pseudomonadota bacterium]
MSAQRMYVTPSWPFPASVRVLAAAAATLMISACTTVQVDKPELAVEVPQQFDSVNPTTAQGSKDIAQWWQQLEDPVLSGYIEEGLRQNVDVRIALARIKEARAFHGMAESAYYPSVDAVAGAGRTRQTGGVPIPDANNGTTFPGNLPFPLPGNLVPSLPDNLSMPQGNSHAYGLTATWEVDVFGARHSDAEMVSQLIQGAHEQEHGAQLMVASDIATRYFEARGVEKRMRILERAIYVAERGVKYAQGRFRSGQTEAAEMARAEMMLRDAQSKVEPLKALLASHLRRIAVLMGKPPQSLTELPPMPPGARRPPSLPAVMPGDVLARRPDVRGVERKVRAQMAKVGSARAELFPKFYIGMGTSAGRIHPDDMEGYNFGTQTLGVGLRLPIFTAGRIRANIAANEAQLEGVALEYEKTVLGALEDVENVYNAHHAYTSRVAYLSQSADLAHQFARERMALFGAGQSLLQAALEAQADALEREDDATVAEVELNTHTVLLYKALGGGWSDQPVKSVKSADAPAKQAEVEAKPMDENVKPAEVAAVP